MLPFLPDRAVDPWGLFNPLRFGFLIFVIALLQFSAYSGIRIFGSTIGVLLSGFLAGLVSSTAATATLAHQAKKKHTAMLPTAAAIILATVAMFIEFGIIIFIVSPPLAKLMVIPLGSTAIIMLFITYVIHNYYKSSQHYPAVSKPLFLMTAFRVALFLFTMLIIVTIAQRFFSDVGASIVIFLGGLVEIHGVGWAVANLFQNNGVTESQAIFNLGLAVIASFISKFAIIWSISRDKFALILSILLFCMLSIFVAVWLGLIYALV